MDANSLKVISLWDPNLRSFAFICGCIPLG